MPKKAKNRCPQKMRAGNLLAQPVGSDLTVCCVMCPAVCCASVAQDCTRGCARGCARFCAGVGRKAAWLPFTIRLFCLDLKVAGADACLVAAAAFKSVVV